MQFIKCSGIEFLLHHAGLLCFQKPSSHFHVFIHSLLFPFVILITAVDF